MAERDDLGLSLSLGGAAGGSSGGGGHHQHRLHALQLNLIPPSQPFFLHQKPAPSNWVDLATSTSGEDENMRRFLRGIDVNRAPAAEREMEDDAAASSPNSTVSSVSGKRCARDESENDRACSGGGPASDEEDGGDGSRKKLRLSKDQSAVLEESFKEHNTLNPKQKLALAKQLNLRPRQVEVWFQNRRARTKLKQTEVDCEFLKRCCENLTEENRRLQKEVQELRAFKLSPQFYMPMTPPTTLTMCPSCERLAVSSSGTATTAAKVAAPVPMDAQNQRTGGNVGGGASRQQFFHQKQQQQQMPFFQQAQQSRGGPALPWAPTPLRTAPFLETQAQRL